MRWINYLLIVAMSATFVALGLEVDNWLSAAAYSWAALLTLAIVLDAVKRRSGS